MKKIAIIIVILILLGGIVFFYTQFSPRKSEFTRRNIEYPTVDFQGSNIKCDEENFEVSRSVLPAEPENIREVIDLMSITRLVCKFPGISSLDAYYKSIEDEIMQERNVISSKEVDGVMIRDIQHITSSSVETYNFWKSGQYFIAVELPPVVDYQKGPREYTESEVAALFDMLDKFLSESVKKYKPNR